MSRAYPLPVPTGDDHRFSVAYHGSAFRAVCGSVVASLVAVGPARRPLLLPAVPDGCLPRPQQGRVTL